MKRKRKGKTYDDVLDLLGYAEDHIRAVRVAGSQARIGPAKCLRSAIKRLWQAERAILDGALARRWLA